MESYSDAADHSGATCRVPRRTGPARSASWRLLRFWFCEGTSSGPYRKREVFSFVPVTERSAVCVAVKTGNGVSLRPSPTEKHNAPTMTAARADDITREPIARENFFIGRSI